MTGSEFKAENSSPSATTLKQSQQQFNTRNHQQRNNIFSTYQDQYDPERQKQSVQQYCANNSYLNGSQ